MIIYHGSTVPVKTPKILKSERMLDFGEGFYTTSNKDQADRWSQRVAAKRNSNARFITEYEFALEAAKTELCVISLDEPNDEWLEFVCQNRSGRIPSSPYDIALPIYPAY